jgi:hypothetical protein
MVKSYYIFGFVKFIEGKEVWKFNKNNYEYFNAHDFIATLFVNVICKV